MNVIQRGINKEEIDERTLAHMLQKNVWMRRTVKSDWWFCMDGKHKFQLFKSVWYLIAQN